MSKAHPMTFSFGEQEFGGAELGDVRRAQRLVLIADAAMANPDASLPKMMGSDAALEGTYRFLNHPHLLPEHVLEPHVRRTVERCAELDTVFIAHDTTDLLFGGDEQRNGLGFVRNQKQGFQAHFSIAVQPGESRQVLGVLEIQRFNDVWKEKKRPHSSKSLRKPGEKSAWQLGVESAMGRFGNGCSRIVHLMDRAADGYALWAFLLRNEQRFVIRLQHNRLLGNKQKLLDCLDELGQQRATLVREVPISRRRREQGRAGGNLVKAHPPRDARIATLEVRARAVLIPKSEYAGASSGKNARIEGRADSLCLNVVHVTERDVPEGCAGVDWKLITTEPIHTPAQVAKIVDAYCARWIIEEYFKALKTGCAIEKRQLDSYEALAMILALLAPVAWRLLQLRSLATAQPDAPASRVLTETQLKVLRVKARDGLPVSPTVADALFAVARLGGYLKHNKMPGWQVIGRGFHDLLLMEVGWLSALNERRSDQ